jgi:F-type H+-transporting ATPase subunit b
MLLFLAAAAGHVEGAEHGITTGETVLGLNAEGWVYVSLTIFLVGLFLFGRAHHRVRDALDARIADTRRELDEAARLRAEAEALLAEAQARNAASAGDAQAIVAHAEQEATALLAKAETDADELMRRRAAMAEDKIAAAERQALADVRAKAAEAAASAASEIIANQHGANADKALVDRTIAGLGLPN